MAVVTRCILRTYTVASGCHIHGSGGWVSRTQLRFFNPGKTAVYTARECVSYTIQVISNPAGAYFRAWLTKKETRRRNSFSSMFSPRWPGIAYFVRQNATRNVPHIRQITDPNMI